MGTAVRFIRDSDLPAVQALSSQLFPWKEQGAFDLGSCITAHDRWLCLTAAFTQDSSDEQLVGFVVAAIGFVREYTADRERLVEWLTGPEVTWQDAEGWAATATEAEADGTLAVQVCLLGVTYALRRQRIASALMARAHNWARSRGAQLLFLYVDPTEAGALQFYARHGFVSASTVPDYYAPGREALLYVLPIDSGPDWGDWSDAGDASSAQQYIAETSKPRSRMGCMSSSPTLDVLLRTTAAWHAQWGTNRSFQAVHGSTYSAAAGTIARRGHLQYRCICHHSSTIQATASSCQDVTIARALLPPRRQAHSSVHCTTVLRHDEQHTQHHRWHSICRPPQANIYRAGIWC